MLSDSNWFCSNRHLKGLICLSLSFKESKRSPPKWIYFPGIVHWRGFEKWEPPYLKLPNVPKQHSHSSFLHRVEYLAPKLQNINGKFLARIGTVIGAKSGGGVIKNMQRSLFLMVLEMPFQNYWERKAYNTYVYYISPNVLNWIFWPHINVNYKLALAMGTCHLPLQRLNYMLLQLLIFNTLWKAFRVESRNEVLCNGGKNWQNRTLDS